MKAASISSGKTDAYSARKKARAFSLRARSATISRRMPLSRTTRGFGPHCNMRAAAHGADVFTTRRASRACWLAQSSASFQLANTQKEAEASWKLALQFFARDLAVYQTPDVQRIRI